MNIYLFIYLSVFVWAHDHMYIIVRIHPAIVVSLFITLCVPRIELRISELTVGAFAHYIILLAL